MKARSAARNSATCAASSALTLSMARSLVACRTDSSPADQLDEPWGKRLRELRDAVEARDEHLSPVVLECGDDALRYELRLGHDPAHDAAREALVLREAGRLDEPGEDRMDTDPARLQLDPRGAGERELRVLRGGVWPGG